MDYKHCGHSASHSNNTGLSIELRPSSINKLSLFVHETAFIVNMINTCCLSIDTFQWQLCAEGMSLRNRMSGFKVRLCNLLHKIVNFCQTNSLGIADSQLKVLFNHFLSPSMIINTLTFLMPNVLIIDMKRAKRVFSFVKL
ncbi:hypothetical protein BD560DRAFT_419191 [Blakeslea trispora]|nr:hypothetical protein BD560DRAFT_419191 [Blakeslea trispora]